MSWMGLEESKSGDSIGGADAAPIGRGQLAADPPGALVLELGRRAAAGAGPSELVDLAVSRLPGALGAELVAIWRFDARIGRVGFEYGSGWPSDPRLVPLGAQEVPLLLPDAPLAFSTGSPRRDRGRVQRRSSNFEHAPGVLAAAGVRSGIVAPLTGHGRKLEAIGIYSISAREFGDAEVAAVATVAELIGAARGKRRGVRLDEELDTARRQASLGTLISAVAHDFNNMISVMVGRARLLASEEPPVGADLVDEAAREIEAAGRSAARLARGLVDLSRPLRVVPERLDASPVVAEVVELMTRLIDERIELHTEMIPAEAWVLMPPGELDRVLVNLITNARDAIAGTGTIVVSLAIETPELGPACVAISVTDDGVGMAPDVLARALEPSFTTKPAGEGSGIGLASVATIVRSAAGTVRLDSKPGEGTTATVSLPFADPSTT